MAYRSLPKFNPEARFIANRAFLYNGHTLQPGDAVEGIPERRLRQLFERRDVGCRARRSAAQGGGWRRQKGEKVNVETGSDDPADHAVRQPQGRVHPARYRERGHHRRQRDPEHHGGRASGRQHRADPCSASTPRPTRRSGSPGRRRSVAELQFPPVAMPPDLDPAAPVEVHLICAQGREREHGHHRRAGVLRRGRHGMRRGTLRPSRRRGREYKVAIAAADVAAHPEVLNISLVPVRARR